MTPPDQVADVSTLNHSGVCKDSTGWAGRGVCQRPGCCSVSPAPPWLDLGCSRGSTGGGAGVTCQTLWQRGSGAPPLSAVSQPLLPLCLSDTKPEQRGSRSDAQESLTCPRPPTVCHDHHSTPASGADAARRGRLRRSWFLGSPWPASIVLALGLGHQSDLLASGSSGEMAVPADIIERA